jgi:casein kinase II subunit beta
MLFMVYPQMIPAKTQPVGEVSRGLGIAGSLTGAGREQPSSVGTVSTAAAAVKAERYEPRIFGFRVNEEAKLSRWRTARRDT